MKTFIGFFVVSLVCVVAGSCGAGCSTVRHAGGNIQEGRNDSHAADSGISASKERHFTIVASAESGGSISPSGATSVPRGASQTFVATADPGYEVVDVLVDGRSVGALADRYRDDSSSYTFNRTERNHVILASFDVLNRVADAAHGTR